MSFQEQLGWVRELTGKMLERLDRMLDLDIEALQGETPKLQELLFGNKSSFVGVLIAVAELLSDLNRMECGGKELPEKDTPLSDGDMSLVSAFLDKIRGWPR